MFIDYITNYLIQVTAARMVNMISPRNQQYMLVTNEQTGYPRRVIPHFEARVNNTTKYRVPTKN